MSQSLVKFLITKQGFSCAFRLMLTLTISLWAVGAQATDKVSPPGSWPSAWTYRLEAQISGVRLNMNAKMEWAVTEDRYEAKLNYSLPLIGHRTQISKGTWTPQGLSPEFFVESTSRRQTDLAFYWTDKKVHRNQALYHEGLQLGAQDTLSVFFEMGIRTAQLSAQNPTPSSMTVNVVGTRKVEDWTFRFIGLETLDLPAGQFKVWRWQRPAAADDKGVKTDIWFAPSLSFLPVRIRLSQSNGDVMDQLLRTLK